MTITSTVRRFVVGVLGAGAIAIAAGTGVASAEKHGTVPPPPVLTGFESASSAAKTSQQALNPAFKAGADTQNNLTQALKA